MKKIFSVDRIEGNIAVCISDDDDRVEVDISQLCGMTARDVFAAELEGDRLYKIVPMPSERDARIERNRQRRHRLAMRSKNNGDNQ